MTALSLQVLSNVGSQVLKSLIKSSPIEIRDNNRIQTYEKYQFRNRKGMIMSTSPVMITPLEDLPVYTLKEISYHDNLDDCWVVIYDRVFDITTFVNEHPGGYEVMLEHAGRDATLAFRSVGHSKMAELALEPYLIGALPTKEQLWSRILTTGRGQP